MDTPIRLKTLLRQRHWQTHRAFLVEYDRVARAIDPRLVGSGPSRAQLHRWISGDIKGLPYPDHCRVLEAMFPGWTAEQLFTTDQGPDSPAGLTTDGPETVGNGAQKTHSGSLGSHHRPVSTGSLVPPTWQAAERAFFGAGPVTVALPSRTMPGRPFPVLASEDTKAAERLSGLLADLAFQVDSLNIPTDGIWTPQGNVIAICGPKSSRVTAEAIQSDPYLTFEPDHSGRWTIRERDGSRVYESPMDEPNGSPHADVAYVARLVRDNQILHVIAGVHALGSVGAVHFLAHNLTDLYGHVGTRRFSMVIGSEHTPDTVTRSYVVCPPRVHR